MNAGMTTRDIWIRHTDVNGATYPQCHRVWDGDRFVASQQEAAEKLNADQKPGLPRKARAEQITEEQFNAERKSKS